jgi:hypothetical protein
MERSHEHDEDRDDEREGVATAGEGASGPGRYSDPGDAGAPLSDEGSLAGTSPGTPGEAGEPREGGPDPVPRREQGGL